VNDTFGLLSQSGLTSLNCTIFNRWGNLIRTFDKPNFSWDGTDESNHPVTAGIYFYIITAKTSGGLEFTKQGFIHLIR
jgi:gliding motility-associated-like protein